jgi:hypothetical protein
MLARHSRFLLPIPLLIFTAAFARAEGSDKQFHWNGKLAADNVIQVKGINGSIDARRAAGDEAEVTADISGPNADEVRIELVPNANGITVCEIYRGHNSCEGGKSSGSDSDYRHIRINYHVLVPSTIHFHGQTINGGVTADNLDRSIKATSVNGSVRVSTKSWVEATSVNGSVVVTMGSSDWTGSLHISTVNGSVTVGLPPDANVDVSFSSVNGRLSSDFPLTTQSVARNRMEGRIGSGGRDLRLSSVNGNVEIKKN